MTKEITKEAFRKASIASLKKASKQGAYLKDKFVLERLYEEIVQANAQSIMLYIPLGMEVNLFPLILKLRKEKRKLYVPFMEGASFRLVRYRLPLQVKRFGIKEPKDSKQVRNKQIDMAIVPIVGVDLTHRRVGFGKGMYDRFFEKNHKNIKEVVFVARKLCYTHTLVTNHYDVKADKIIAPR
ncbi:MAG: 5-formyltetrahydrofolate cyclo-ligase [Sulfurovum sp.]|nr:5-formyltetrahydrofolate cyclo-ligase [Sulfurovum sp.]